MATEDTEHTDGMNAESAPRADINFRVFRAFRG